MKPAKERRFPKNFKFCDCISLHRPHLPHESAQRQQLNYALNQGKGVGSREETGEVILVKMGWVLEGQRQYTGMSLRDTGLRMIP